MIVHTAKPGVLIGRKGVKAEELKKRLEALTGRRVGLDIMEIARPELDATLVAQNVAEQLMKRAAYRRTLKRAIQHTMERGAKGVKILIAGRLGGQEIARSEKQAQGSIPLSTLKANISLRRGRGAHDLRRHRRQGLDLPRHAAEGPAEAAGGGRLTC